MQHVVFCVLALVAYANAWQNLACQGKPQGCPVKLTNMEFSTSQPTSVLNMDFQNTVDTDFKGADSTLYITTEGYGCVLVFCQWGTGPTLDDPTCSWGGGICNGNGNFIDGGQSKSASIDFADALKQAAETPNCCTVNNRDCGGCIIRGVATWRDRNLGEIAKVSMAFYCDLSRLSNPQCYITTP